MLPDPATHDTHGTPTAALLRPPVAAASAAPPTPSSGASSRDDPAAQAAPDVEPDGTEDPLANADDAMMPGQGAQGRPERTGRPAPERSAPD